MRRRSEDSFVAYAALCPRLTEERAIEIVAAVEFIEETMADPDGARMAREEIRRLWLTRCRAPRRR